jgi:hypothetical protein
VIILESPGISVTMLPERGGKITSLRDTGRGREWLESPEGPLSGPADGSTEYDAGDMCGWDEMMPTISPCDYPGTSVQLPDHGELWSKSWEVTSHTPTSMSTSVRGDALPFRFDRTLRLEARSLHIEYSVTTDSDDELRLLWAAHPLFAVSPGTRVILDPSEFDSSFHDVSVADDFGIGSSHKFFARLLTATSTARIIDANGTFLALRWSRADAPYTGVWLDHMEYSRHPVVAIEPTNCPFDSLSEAVGTDLAWTVSKYAPRRWSIDVEFGGRA